MGIKHKINFTSEKGISLVEIIGSIVILSLVLITFATLSQIYLKTDIKQDKKTDALQVAEVILNELRNDSSFDTEVTRYNYNGTDFSYNVVTKKVNFIEYNDSDSPVEFDGNSSLTQVTMYTILDVINENNEKKINIASVNVSWEE